MSPRGDDLLLSYWSGWVSADGQLKLQTPDGEVIRVRGHLLRGQDGYTPVKGKDYRDGTDGDPGKNGVGVRTVTLEETSGGVAIRITLTDGSSYKGPTIRHGAPGRDPTAQEVADAVSKFMLDNPVPVPKDGRPPTKKEVHDAVEVFLTAHPIPAPKDGEDGEDGEDGAMGPMPQHELDPPENPHRIRFEVGRTTKGTSKWGPWIDLRRLLPKVMPAQGRGGAVGGSESGFGGPASHRVRTRITSPQTTSYTVEDRVDVVIVDASGGDVVVTVPSTTSRTRPVRIKRINLIGGLVRVRAIGGSVEYLAEVLLDTQFDAVDLEPDGPDWLIF